MDYIVDRVHFLRARAQKNRWTEELLLVEYEMRWTAQYFSHQVTVWKGRAAAAESSHLGGHDVVCRATFWSYKP